jgi:hypothetical protein
MQVTNWNVVGSIPDVIGYFHSTWPVHPHYGPGVDTVSNREEYKEPFWGAKGDQPARKADNLTAIFEPIV